MLVLIIVLLAIWLVLSTVGFAVKGIVGLALFAIVFIAVAGAVVYIRRSFLRRKVEQEKKELEQPRSK